MIGTIIFFGKDRNLRKLVIWQLNKNILNSVGGDVHVVSSTKYGTTFELKVPGKLRENVDISTLVGKK